MPFVFAWNVTETTFPGWTSNFLQGSRKTRPCLSGHVVCGDYLLYVYLLEMRD